MDNTSGNSNNAPHDLQKFLMKQRDMSRTCFALLSLLLLQYEHEGHIDSALSDHLQFLMAEAEEQLAAMATQGFEEVIPF